MSVCTSGWRRPRSALLARVDELLPAEIAKQGFGDMDASRLDAYREACVAFIDERLETYNPIGIQYTFGTTSSRTAAELEFQLNWYNSRPEFADLVAAARSLAGAGVSDGTLQRPCRRSDPPGRRLSRPKHHGSLRGRARPPEAARLHRGVCHRRNHLRPQTRGRLTSIDN